MDGKILLRKWEFWAFVVTFLSLIVGLVTLFFQVRSVRMDVKSVQQDVERVEEQTVRSQFKISYPFNGNIVDLTDLVRGSTPYFDRNHYIVVTPLETGDDWIQEGIIKVYTGGTWIGRARFGTATVGPGKKFIARAIATKSKLSSGILTEVPEDAIFSDSIEVIRKK